MEARLEALVKDWKAGTFHCAYYFIGEQAFAAQAVAQLKAILNPDTFNFAQFSGDIDPKAEAIVAEALTSPAFGPRRLIIVDNPKIPAKARAEFVQYLQSPLETSTIVFFSGEKKIDPKDTLARAVGTRGAVCLIRPLREDEAQKKLQEEARKSNKTLAPQAALLLVQEIGTDWAILRQELEKALLFAGDSPHVEREHVLQCLGYQKSADPFALPRLIQSRALKESISYLKKMFESGKPDDQAFKALNQITAAVSKQYRAKLLVKAGTPKDILFRTLRLNDYYDGNYLVELGRHKESRLVSDLERCLATDVALKSKAWLEPKIEIEHLVVDLCRKA